MASTGPTIPVLLRRRDERRQAERFVAAMPVTVDGHPGTTRDLSSSGLSFDSDRPYMPGARIAVVIDYLLDGHSYPLRCEAEVVRLQPTKDGYTVGARLTPESRLPEVAVANADAVVPGPGIGRGRLRSVD